MPRPYKLTIPENASEILDHLAGMIGRSPDFKHDFYPDYNIDTAFKELIAGFEHVRKKIGEERYERLLVMAAQMRRHFETHETTAGCLIAYDMEDVLDEVFTKNRRS